MVRVHAIKGKKDLHDFIMLPWKVYHGDRFWVPPLVREQKDLFNPQKNPFYQHARVELFLARENGDTVGRIAAIVNENHNRFHNEKTGFFGFFEALPDYSIAERLLTVARKWLKQRGMEVMRGPMNFSTNEECGLLIEGFDSSPLIMMTYNPRYYKGFMERYGLHKARDLFAFWIDSSLRPSEKVRRIFKKMSERQGVRVRHLNMKDFDQEVERIKAIYNSAWSGNWGFVPMTDEEFDHLAKLLKRIVVPELVLIAEVDGEPVAFSMALPDYNQVLKRLNGRLGPVGVIKLLWFSRKIKQARLLTLGIKEGYRKRGIDSLLYMRTLLTAREKGYVGGEVSWTLEDNLLINRAIEMMGGKLYKKYRIYEIEI
ncbi:MAG TPA: N-acetyltransferase [Candidatus Latescibacteria bacterium]|nr:N-acetyltransferase [Candidatus Latescibacterota bacterium]